MYEKEKMEPWLVPIRSNMRKVYNKPTILQKMEDDESVQDEAETLMSLCEQRLHEIFEGWENGSEDLSEVEECLGRMKYLNNLIHR